MEIIHQHNVKEFIENIKDGVFFSMYFIRVAPKCLKCQKSDKKWVGLTHCPICGEPLSFERETVAQKGVSNPAKHIHLTGTGESAKEAILDNRIKFYDVNAVDKNGNKGGYRQARIENIKRIKAYGTEYIVVP